MIYYRDIAKRQAIKQSDKQHKHNRYNKMYIVYNSNRDEIA